jgi:hypothetical protein
MTAKRLSVVGSGCIFAHEVLVRRPLDEALVIFDSIGSSQGYHNDHSHETYLVLVK